MKGKVRKEQTQMRGGTKRPWNVGPPPPRPRGLKLTRHKGRLLAASIAVSNYTAWPRGPRAASDCPGPRTAGQAAAAGRAQLILVPLTSVAPARGACGAQPEGAGMCPTVSSSGTGREPTAFATGPQTAPGKSRKAGRRGGGRLLSRQVTSTEGSPATLSVKRLN